MHRDQPEPAVSGPEGPRWRLQKGFLRHANKILLSQRHYAPDADMFRQMPDDVPDVISSSSSRCQTAIRRNIAAKPVRVRSLWAKPCEAKPRPALAVVEVNGIEPSTSGLQSRRSPS